MFSDHTPWDDGAATPVAVSVTAAGQPTIINGPLVFIGYSLKNSAGGTAQIEFFDGAGQELWQTSIAAGGNQQGFMGDRGVLVKTDLEISVSGNEPVTGVVYVRTAQGYTERVRHWHIKFGRSKSPSQDQHSPVPHSSKTFPSQPSA